MISVSANLFRAAAECVSTEETRYYLSGVYVSPHPQKGVLLVATDGHRLMCVHDENGKCDKAQIVGLEAKHIDAKSLKAMRAAMPGEEPRLTVDSDGIATFGTYRSLKSCIIDGVYPDWPRVVAPMLARAKEGKFSPATVNQKYLSAFGKIAVMLSPDGHPNAPFRVVSHTEADPLLIRFGSCDNAFGLLMPMRSSIPNELPIFMQPILEPPAAAPEKKAPPRKLSARKKFVKHPAARKAKKAAKRRAA